MKKYSKNGISLLVLVITIIVVIILAGTVIMALGNGGILDSAKKSRFMSDYKSVEEGVNLYSASNINLSNPNNFKLPLEGKLSLSDKQDIVDNVPTLKVKIEELNPGKTIDDIDLYWINETEVGINSLSSNKKDKGYIIDVATNQIYDYVGDVFEGKRWHTLDAGVTEIAFVPDIQEMWDGWMKLTLYYPPNSTNKMWRLGNEGEIRVDPMLMWQNYTGPISIPLDRTKDVWIKYKVGNEDVVIPPAGTLLVDIVPDKTGTTKVKQVNVNINYDSEATAKEYKIGSSDWMSYTGVFTVTENCLIQARAKKTENIYNTDGSLLMTRDIAGKDLVYIGNIGTEDVTQVEDSTLAAPIITRLSHVNGDERARVQITYPDSATKKIYKINYGVEQNYTSEVSIANYGTYVIAYYYDANGKRSLSTSIYINDTTTQPAEEPKQYEPLPPYVPEAPIPYEPSTAILLPAPSITRLAAANGSEKARVQITYPTNAERKIFTQNYGSEQNYTSEISVTAWGTFVMAYYYDTDGNKSQIAWIRVNEIPTDPGTLEPDPIDPAEIVPAPVINIAPNSGLVSQVSVSVTSPVGSTITYLKIGRYGTYQEYTIPVVVRDNVEVYAYYRNASGEKSLEAKEKISNILKNEDGSVNNKPYVAINPNPYPWSGAPAVSEVSISISSSYADKVEYSEDGIIFKSYTAPFKVTENKRIYARATNAYGVSETNLDITNIGGIKAPATIENLAVNINVDPEPILSTTRVASAKVSIEYDSKATEKYYSIGKYGTLQFYTTPFDVTNNCTIYAYAKSTNGKGETSKTVDNLLTGISNPVIVSSPSNSIQASKVGISIAYDKYATVKKYSINGGILTDYTGEFDVSTNGTTVYAYSENSLGQKSSASYTVENIIPPPPVLVLDKGNYYLLKLNYPESSMGREYKWKENGDWKTYNEAGILLIKPQYKDSVIKNGTLVKIEDENGNLVTFTGDYYLIDVPISELFANVSMRWDRVLPSVPQIVINPTEPTHQVTATIVYDSGMVKKQYRLLKSGDTLGDWLNYTGPITIDQNNTIIYAKAMDDSEVWSGETMHKVTNIDKVQPTITASDGGSTSSSVTVTATADDLNGSGINTSSYQYSKDNGLTWTSSTSETSYVFNTLITGTYQCMVKVLDNAGNSAISNVVEISTQGIGAIMMSANPTTWTNGNVIVTITFPQGTILKQYSIDGLTWNTYTTAITIGTNNITVYAKGLDDGGNQTAQATITIANIDKVVPVISYGTNGQTNSTQVSTTITASDLGGSGLNTTTLQYKWDTQNITAPSSGWTTFTNGATQTKTENGLYYLWVKASDNAGNIVITKSNPFIVGDIPASAVRTENTTYAGETTGFSYNNPVIPAGFVAINTTDANWDNLSTDWDKGLVIQDLSANQFVWVPVDGTNVTYAKWTTSGIAYNNMYISDDSVPSGFNVSNITTTYKGFYIARYEAMFDYNGGSIRAASKKSINKFDSSWTKDSAHTGYLWNFINYTSSKTYSENMATSYGYDTSKVGTNLVTGAEWDTVMKWIQNSGKNVATDSRAWGNYSNSISPANVTGYGALQISGYSNCWKAKNIFDLAGNRFEWINERYNTSRICRGGGGDTGNGNSGIIYPASTRFSIGLYTNSFDFISFRTALYVL